MWSDRIAHLAEIRKARALTPTFESVAAQDLRLDDRFRFCGVLYTVTGIRRGDPFTTIQGEYAAEAVTVDFLPFEAVDAQLPRPPQATP